MNGEYALPVTDTKTNTPGKVSASVPTKYYPRMPMPVCWGFEAGVLRIAWMRDPPYEVTGRIGVIRTAEITEVHTDRSQMTSETIRSALHGLVVRGPDGAPSRITGVEMFCTVSQNRGSSIGLLLVPMEEP